MVKRLWRVSKSSYGPESSTFLGGLQRSDVPVEPSNGADVHNEDLSASGHENDQGLHRQFRTTSVSFAFS